MVYLLGIKILGPNSTYFLTNVFISYICDLKTQKEKKQISYKLRTEIYVISGGLIQMRIQKRINTFVSERIGKFFIVKKIFKK